MAMGPIEFLHFNKKKDPKLFQKLNAVAPIIYLKVHSLARSILLKGLDDLIRQHNIDIYPQSEAQPAVG
jgi:hypothetical protein